MRIKIFLTLIIFTFLSSQIFSKDYLVRYPSISNDATKIAFSYQGDIWVYDLSTKDSKRITIHEAYDYLPKWSKDDSKIAFTSNRYGNNDIFIIPSKGGVTERITYHSAGDVITDYSDDANILFSTSRNYRHVEWDHQLDFVNDKGGTPELLIDAIGEMATKSPNGRFITFAKGWGRVTREEYQGSANYDIWIYDTKNKTYSKLTDFNGHDIFPTWSDNSTLYFLSSQLGKYNIYKMKIDENGKQNGESEILTSFVDNSIRHFDVSADGSKIVFEQFDKIKLLNTRTNQISELHFDLNSDYRFDPEVFKTFTNKMTDFKVSPNGKYTAFVVRGEIFMTENDKEKSKTINLSNHPYRDQDVDWINDTTLIFTSDREGQFDLFTLVSDDKGESNIFKSLKHKISKITDTPEEESNPIVSPDKKKLVYTIGRGNLVVTDISNDATLTNKYNLLDGWATPGGIEWSPDSKWIAYSMTDLTFNNEIFIQPIDKSIEPVNVSMHPRSDHQPYWSKDGKKLAFVSERKNNDADIWFVWLTKKDWEMTKSDWDDFDEPKKDKKKKDDKDSSAVEPLKIDTDKIWERLVQLTNAAGNESSPIFSKDGETIYFVAKSPTEKGRDIFKIKWDGKDLEQVTKGGKNPGGLENDVDGKYIYFSSKGSLNRLDLKGDKSEALPFKAKMQIDFAKENKQKFEESWRALRDGFYDPNFHGQDWNDLKKRYEPLCLMASTDQDFQDMFNLMLGELNASHLGLRFSDTREDTEKEKTGLLGLRLQKNINGLEVTHVIQNSPASKTESKIENGDIITSINQNNISDNSNIYSYLTNTADEKLLLGINRNGKNIEVAIRPTESLRNQLYDEWVANNTKLVDELSNGKLGYLHIRAMGWDSFERFEREFTAKGYGKEGIVVDVRFNGGGWTTDYLMLVLNYKQHAYTIPRGAAKNLDTEKTKFRDYYPLGERLPYSAWTKPSIALCNQNSYSNAEIFSHAYKNLGIGTLVGMPTFGAVISTGARMLIDGSYVRMPFRGWFVKADDSNMDMVPAVPNIIIENEPNVKATGNDKQLKKAVEELLKDL